MNRNIFRDMPSRRDHFDENVTDGPIALVVIVGLIVMVATGVVRGL